MKTLSDLLLPVLIFGLLLAAGWKRLDVLEGFARGARQGMEVAVRVLPNLAGMLCAIALMRESGLLGLLCHICAPFLTRLGLPAEVAPLVLVRPLSGSASLGMLETLLERFGPDSAVGMTACIVMGSSETIFYTLCVYFSGVKDKRAGYAALCSLLGMLAGVWLAGRLVSGG